MPDLTVIILTFNEAPNIGQALVSVCNWATHVYVLDSNSTDETCAIAKSYSCQVFYHRFEGYPQQRNYSLVSLPIDTEWVFFLDADEWLTEELKKEIEIVLANGPQVDGFYMKRRLIWMGRWIRRGYYPTWILRLFRRGKAYCGERSVNEHMVVEGQVSYLQHDVIHEDRKGLGEWIAKHNHYAELESQELAKSSLSHTDITPHFGGSQAERKRWLRIRIWERLPLLIRPFFYFSYRYFLKGGFLDGKEAFIYHFLQGLWYPFLIDVKYLEMKRREGR